MKIFRNKLFRIVMVLVITVGLFAFIVNMEKKAVNADITKTIYIVAKDLESKHEVKDSDLATIQVSQLTLPDGYVTNKEDVIGKYTVLPVTKGSFILTNNVTDDKNFENSMIPDGYKMVSVALSIDQASGWKINKNQVVDLIFSPFQYNNSLDVNLELGAQGSMTTSQKSLYTNRSIEDITIVDVINEALVSVDSESFAGVPKYVVILAKDSDAEFIVLAKDKGRFDLLVKSN